jgi:uncharacterized membrane protein YphA (DoxX/SURF4 family)
MNIITKHLPTAARIFLGSVFTVFGANFFLHAIPQPPAPPQADAFTGALVASGYLFPLLSTSEVLAGLMLLRNRFVPLALAMLAPVVVNIVAFHLALAPGGLPVAVAVLAAQLYLAWSHRAAFTPMLRARIEPAPQLAVVPAQYRAAA